MVRHAPRPDLPQPTLEAIKFAQQVNSRAKKRRYFNDQLIGKIPAQDLFIKMELQDWRCIYCLDKISFSHCELDHIHPMSKGGEHYLYNVFFSCPECNLHKGARTVRRFCEKMHMEHEEARIRMAEIDQKLHEIFFPKKEWPDSPPARVLDAF